MPKGVYAAASAMLVESRALDVRARNLANAQTAGYRREEPLRRGFADVFADDNGGKDDQDGSLKGNGGAGILSNGSMFRFADGAPEPTGNPLDLALAGDGFFVATKDGKQLLTRGGNFTQDPLGRLTTREGWPILGQGGPVQIPPEALAVAIDAKGTIQVTLPDGSTPVIDQLRLATVAKPQEMRALSGVHFDYDGQPLIEAKATIRQGALEKSNVDPIQEMVEMISLQRRYDSAQKAISEQTNAGGGFSDILRG